MVVEATRRLGKRAEKAVRQKMTERKRKREANAMEKMGNNHFLAAMDVTRSRVCVCIG